MTPNHDHSVRRCETSKPPVEKSRERARVARVSFLQALDDHSMWHAGRIGFADFIADGAVMLADGVQLHPGICSLVGALLRHLFEVLDAGIAEIVVARRTICSVAILLSLDMTLSANIDCMILFTQSIGECNFEGGRMPYAVRFGFDQRGPCA